MSHGECRQWARSYTGLGRGDVKKHMEPAVIEGPGLDDPGLPDRIRSRDPEALRAVVEAYLGQVLRAARGAGLDLRLSARPHGGGLEESHTARTGRARAEGTPRETLLDVAENPPSPRP